MSSKLIKPAHRRVANEDLTTKERTFVSAYFSNNEMNATEAARQAGYASPSNAGSKLLAKVKIQRAIGVELRKRLENNEITAARVLKELGRIGFIDPQAMFNEDDTLKKIREMPEDIRRCIAGIEVKVVKVKKCKDEAGEDKLLETSIVKIKLWPKTEALNLIAKHLGMLDERFKVTHGIDPQAQAVIKALLHKLESQPSQVIDAEFIEHAASKLPDIDQVVKDDEIGETLDGTVEKG